MKIIEVEKGQFLFTKENDFSDSYFFLLRGKLELVYPVGDDFKFARNADEGYIFVQGTDYARAVSDKCEIIEFSKS